MGPGDLPATLSVGPRADGSLEERTLIGDYRLERLMARGGMGILYEARQISLDRRVALKLVASNIVDDAASRERFVREARAVIELEHPNVVPVYATGEADGCLFIAMRLIEGTDLQRIIDAERSLEQARVVYLVEQIASGLDAAHRMGLTHRDVKPANVMVEALPPDREHCYLVDFGLALRRDATAVTRTGQLFGTPGYLAPEQLRGEPVDARTDTYALGVLAFHALAGQPPYARESHEATLLAHLHAAPPRLTDLRPELARSVDDVLVRALAKSPEERYASAGALAGALARALGGSRSRAQEVVPSARIERAPPQPSATPVEQAPARSLRATAHNLPPEVSSFVGRERDLVRLREVLQVSRLASIVGPGGVGKTRLALQLAKSVVENYEQAWAVELDAVETGVDLPPALARAFGLQLGSGDSILETLIGVFADRSLLVVLDNCEHLVADVAALVGALIGACPALTVLATSREALSVSGEQVYRLPPLDLPGEHAAPEAVAASASVRLLLERAGDLGADIQVTAATASSLAGICSRLEGIPLAIELGAARLRNVTPADLEQRLQDHMHVLTTDRRDGPARQRTLEALIEWSWRLLDGAERLVLARLCVFAGPFTLDAAEAVGRCTEISDANVCAVVWSLADKSLLQADPSGPSTRLRVLEPVRTYCLSSAVERTGDTGARAAHRRYYLSLAEQARDRLASTAARQWLARLDLEHANLRAAIVSALDDGEVDLGLRLGVALQRFWACRGAALDGIHLLRAGLDHADENTPRELEAKAHAAVAYLAAGHLGDYDIATVHADQALDIASSVGDDETRAEALCYLSWMRSMGGRPTEGLRLVDETLATSPAPASATVLGRLLDARGIALEELADANGAKIAYERALRTFSDAADSIGVAYVENHLGNLATGAGDLTGARAHFAHAQKVADSVGDLASTAMSELNLALVEYLAGHFAQARLMFIDSLVANRRRGDHVNVAYAVFGVALTESDPLRAAAMHGSAARRLEMLEHTMSPREYELRDSHYSRLRAELGDEQFAREHARGERLRVEDIVPPAESLARPPDKSCQGRLTRDPAT